LAGVAEGDRPEDHLAPEEALVGGADVIGVHAGALLIEDRVQVQVGPRQSKEPQGSGVVVDRSSEK
jgi:hypothetical protein